MSRKHAIRIVLISKWDDASPEMSRENPFDFSEIA
jgi:hypothetical protein